MALKLMYITNRPDVAQIAESSGVDRIFVDMEYIGKADRQGGMDTVQSHHTVDDIKNYKVVYNTAILNYLDLINDDYLMGKLLPPFAQFLKSKYFERSK